MIRPCERCLGRSETPLSICIMRGGELCMPYCVPNGNFVGGLQWDTSGAWSLHWCVSLPAFLSLICLKRAAMSKRSNSAQSQPQATAMWMCVRLQSLHIDALLQTFEGPLIICISEQFVKFIADAAKHHLALQDCGLTTVIGWSFNRSGPWIFRSLQHSSNICCHS